MAVGFQPRYFTWGKTFWQSPCAVRFFVAGEHKGTRMEIGLGLKVSECYKKFGRFFHTRVETSQPQDGVAARANAFSALIAGQIVRQTVAYPVPPFLRAVNERPDLR